MPLYGVIFTFYIKWIRCTFFTDRETHVLQKLNKLVYSIHETNKILLWDAYLYVILPIYIRSSLANVYTNSWQGHTTLHSFHQQYTIQTSPLLIRQARIECLYKPEIQLLLHFSCQPYYCDVAIILHVDHYKRYVHVEKWYLANSIDFHQIPEHCDATWLSVTTYETTWYINKYLELCIFKLITSAIFLVGYV